MGAVRTAVDCFTEHNSYDSDMKVLIYVVSSWSTQMWHLEKHFDFFDTLILKFLSTFQSFFISKHNFSLIICKYKAKKNYWLVFFLKFTSESRKNIAWESNQNKYTSVISYLRRTCIFCLVESEKLSKIKELSTIQTPINVRKCHLLVPIFF